MRVGIYVRVSTQRQAQADGITQQLERLQARAQQQGWTVAADDLFRDDGFSGASLKRPGLERLRDRAASRALDAVLITAPDRLARNYVHQVLLLEGLADAGCRVEFLDRPMSQDPHDQLLLQIRGAVAEYERDLITERMRRGRQRRLQAGLLLPWSRPPFGYRVDPGRPRDPAGVRRDEAEAAVVAEMFAWYAEEGRSLYGLAQKLQRLEALLPTGADPERAAAVEPGEPARDPDQPGLHRPGLHGTRPPPGGPGSAHSARRRPGEPYHAAARGLGCGCIRPGHHRPGEL